MLGDVLQRVADGAIKRLMIFEPPRHGKSEQVSRLFSAYYLARYPDRWVGLNSYAAELAYTLSRAARENYALAGGAIKADAGAVKHWETSGGGGMWSAGVGGPITGKGFHLGIIDDPIKNAEEAASETIQQAHRDWYQSTFYTRAEPDAAIIIIQTRWHEDDLSGWLLSQETDDEAAAPERWHIVCLPDLAEGEQRASDWPATCTLEPDWREPGEALCPERYPADRLRAIHTRIGSYYASALYGQRPAPREGGLFKRGWLVIGDSAPANASRVRYWDKAATDGGGDYTVGVRMARAGGLYTIEDVVRGQWSPGERERIIRRTAESDGQGVAIWTEQEPGSGGKESAISTVRNLAGFTVRAEPVTGSKEIRAEPLAAQAEAGNLRIVRAPWNEALINEMCAFPHSAHDDVVDAASGAFNKLSQRPWWDDKETLEKLAAGPHRKQGPGGGAMSWVTKR